MRKNRTTMLWAGEAPACTVQAMSVETVKLDLHCLRGEASCGTCSRHHILCEELIVTLVYIISHTKYLKAVLKETLFSSRDIYSVRRS